MKKLLLIPALLAGSLLVAEQKLVEISPMIGYDIAEGNFDLDKSGYPLLGLEVQFNAPDSKISSEFSLLYSQGVDYATGGDTKVTRGAFNGVYTFDAMSYVTPFAKIGAGYENVGTETEAMQDGFFLDAGAGVKVPFNDTFALKFETLYMAKLASDNAGSMDSNLLVMAGLTIAFGDFAQKEAPKTEAAPVEEKVVEEKVVEVVEPVVVAPVVVIIEADDDNDTIVNSKDECPSTPIGTKVNEKGCDVDTDKDGILNENDICPNTLENTVVNSDGCPKTIPLNITFENNSDTIKSQSDANIQEYADFLNKHTNYSAKIVGYTDSRGSESYNQKLSEKRANAVVSALEAKGVNAKQLSAKGAGEANPIADNATAEGRAQNRRIEAELTRN
jgi:OOP family OmpA-OmpF porin